MVATPTFDDIPAALARAAIEAAEEPGPDGRPRWVLRGRTFDARDVLKRHGARFESARRVWIVGERASLDAIARALPERPRGLAEATAKPDYSGWGSKHYHGHRERLRQRFLEIAPDALADYELLELLLFFSVYRRDTKPLAKSLIERFGGLGGVLAAEPTRYAEVGGLDLVERTEDSEKAQVYDDDLKFTTVLLKAVHETMLRVLKEQIKDRPVIGSWTALIDYLHAAMAHEAKEHFRILFLDRKNILLRDEVQSQGTVDHTPLYPREVVKRALELGASAIIMVHNHPSGDPTPSKADIEMTKQVVTALQAVDITVHDHVIVGKNKHLSFRSQRLI